MLKNQFTIGQVIDEWISEKKLAEPIHQVKIELIWTQTMGTMIANHTKQIELKNQKLYVTVDNPALKQELFYSRDKIKEVINSEIGKLIIKEVYIY